MGLPRTLIKVNGSYIPDPASISWSIQDLDYEEGTGRNQKGYLFRDRVAKKRKLTMKWNAMYGEDMKDLLQAVDDVFFKCSFYDPHDGEFLDGDKALTMYVGDRTAPQYNKVGGKIIFTELTMNFIER